MKRLATFVFAAAPAGCQAPAPEPVTLRIGLLRWPRDACSDTALNEQTYREP